MSGIYKKYTDVSEFEVSRKNWLRGKKDSCLLDQDGKMCCLGFYARACGLPDNSIKLIGSPAGVRPISINHWETKLINHNVSNTNDCQRLMEINDDLLIDDTFREAQLIYKFLELGITVKFVD